MFIGGAILPRKQCTFAKYGPVDRSGLQLNHSSTDLAAQAERQDQVIAPPEIEDPDLLQFEDFEMVPGIGVGLNLINPGLATPHYGIQG